MKYLHSVKFTWLGTLSGLLIVLSLISCGLSMPSESDGQKALKTKAGTSEKIVSFKKINGQSSEVFGVKTYSMQYEAIREDVCNVPGSTSLCIDYTGRTVKNGEKLLNQLKGTITFTKSEKGWDAVNIEIKIN